MDDIVSKLKNSITMLLVDEPVYGMLLLKMPVIASNEVETIATDGVRLIVNKDFVENLEPKQLVSVLAHEAEHVIRLHPLRKTKIVKHYVDKGYIGEQINRVANILADCIVNEYLPDKIKNLLPEPITFDKVGLPEEAKKMSLEELVEYVIKNAIHVNLDLQLASGDLVSRDIEGEKLLDGDRDFEERLCVFIYIINLSEFPVYIRKISYLETTLTEFILSLIHI